ncbi:unnamed protein product [Diabrotica balteata]|uniref:MORN repeat-containing protein 5 n=1 Tax=Diabrotica balteata TaxID=107213 RepID=A0A9P0DY49_DIABA|nr:unnamed protein product [Diabrotica balteata]
MSQCRSSRRSYKTSTPRYTRYDWREVSYISSGPIHHKLTIDWEKELPQDTSKPPKYLVTFDVPGTDQLVEKPLEEYITGSSYIGTHNQINFSGIGTYYYPHGVIYKGTFKDGQFHGNGTLIYPNDQRVEGVWRNGKLKDSTYIYHDGLQYQKDWNYLRMPDRAYMEEINCGFRPPGTELVSNKKIVTKIPPDTFETGDDGYYDDKKKIIYSKDHKMRRIVDAHEMELIRNNYRQEADKPVKYYPQVYEYWSTGRQRDVKKIQKRYSIHKQSKDSATDSEVTTTDYSIEF